MKILLIEDERKIAAFVVAGLERAGFTVEPVYDGNEGLKIALSAQHDLILLDLMLPSIDGIELLKVIRAKGVLTPVIILSAKGDISDKLAGFESGSNDYLPKPFYVEELVARIRAQLNRNETPQVRQLAVNGLELDVISRKLTWNRQVSSLSPHEFHLLELLMRSPEKIFSRKEILQNIWGVSFDPNTNVVEVCVQRVKNKLSRNQPKGASPIETIRGVGYRLAQNP